MPTTLSYGFIIPIPLHPVSLAAREFKDEISVINVFRVRVEGIGMMNP